MKVTIVGAGNVGATCADAIATQRIASEVVLLDIKEGFAEGKALDMMQTATTLGFNTKIVGTTNDYTKTANSNVVVITSGIPRKPGMTREELIGINAGIVQSVAEEYLGSFTGCHYCGGFQPDGYHDLPDIKENRIAKKPHHWNGWRFGQFEI
jgi:malate dehydrogenase